MLSFVTLLSYDYKYAYDAIKSYYDIADEIILGYDKDFISWAGNKFEINLTELEEFIKDIEGHGPKKIKLISGKYHGFVNPMENEVYERNMLKDACSLSNWIIQIDCDERLINPNEFKSWIETAPKDRLITANWMSIFKIIDNKKIIIDAKEKVRIGTWGFSLYESGRGTKQKELESPLLLSHYSWGRTPEELWQKLTNWGHKNDFDTSEFFELWKSVNLDNYKDFKNIHPLNGTDWPSLKILGE